MSETQRTGDNPAVDLRPIKLTDADLRRLILQVAFWEDWVVRRIETVTILDETRIRRHVSMDFVLETEGHPDTGDDTDSLRVVPVTY